VFRPSLLVKFVHTGIFIVVVVVVGVVIDVLGRKTKSGDAIGDD